MLTKLVTSNGVRKFLLYVGFCFIDDYLKHVYLEQQHDNLRVWEIILYLNPNLGAP